MDWTINKHDITAYTFLNGKPMEITVYDDGRYKAIISNNTNNTSYSRPEIYFSGKADTMELAKQKVEQLCNFCKEPKEKIEKVDVYVKVENSVDEIEVTFKTEPEEISEVKEEVEEPKIVEDYIQTPIETENDVTEVFDLSKDYVCEVTVNNQENGKEVVINTNFNKVKYTTDGKEITKTSKVYREPFIVGLDVTTLKVAGYDENNELIFTKDFTI